MSNEPAGAQERITFLLAGTMLGAGFTLVALLLVGSDGIKNFILGSQTLIGAIIGSAAVGYQVARGFRNQLLAQQQAAEADREARIHQAEILQNERTRVRLEDAKTLASALRGELVGGIQYTIDRLKVIHTSELNYTAAKHFGYETFSVNEIKPFRTPIYDSSLSSLGPLGASIVGDLVLVYGRLKAEFQGLPKVPTSQGKATLQILVDENSKLQNDVLHVAMRLLDFENGDPVRETLTERDVRQSASAEG